MIQHVSGRFRLLACLLALVLALGAAGCREAPQPVVYPDDGYGFAAGAAQIWMNDEDSRRELDAVAETGAQWLRVHIDWQFIEPVKGQFNWSYADRWINGARDRGLQVLGLVVNTPEWARAPGAPIYAPPERTSDFSEFVTEVVKRYQARIWNWEIWNEPNLPRFMGFSEVRPRRYVDMLRTAYQAIKVIQPQSTVIAAGLSRAVGVDAPPNFVNDMYIAGAKGFFDALAMHPYAYPNGKDADLYNGWSDIARVHDIMTVHGDGHKKIWMTELGAPTSDTTDEAVTQEEQARQIVDVLAGLHRSGYSGPAFIFSIRDTNSADPDDVEDNFGALLTSDWQPKYTAVVLARPPDGGWR